VNDCCSALEYGEDVPAHPRELRVWLFHAYLRRLEWMACHHLEELATRIRQDMVIPRWIFFPPWQTHRFRLRIQEEQTAALAAATWVLARDTGFLVEERILFARACRWARCLAYRDAVQTEINAKKRATRRMTWTPSGWKKNGDGPPPTTS